MRTQVGIIGGGPAGLMLSHLLARDGIESVVLEQRTREELATTVRAGVLEHGTVELLIEVGLGERLQREGAVHHGIELRFNAEPHRIALSELTGGRAITLYAQHEVIKDLLDARSAAQGQVLFEARGVHVTDLEGRQPGIHFERGGVTRHLQCDYVVGCEGYNSLVRNAIPVHHRHEYHRQYPFGWLGLLVEAPRVIPELIYARHRRGFALVSTRSETLQRLYLQCDPRDNLDNWSDERIWEELLVRLEAPRGVLPQRGPILHKDIVAMRSFVCEPMQYGRAFLAGDAAHIVPPTGAKGMNLAIADVRILAAAFAAQYRDGRDHALAKYSASCLKRVWQAQRFSWWMTAMLHRFPGDDFQAQIQLAELEAIVQSRSAAAALAERYVG